MEILEFGYRLLRLSAGVVAAIAIFSLLSVAFRSRRFVVTARVGFYILAVLLTGVSATLISGFLTGAYNNEYIFQHSEEALSTGFKFAGLWAGLEGSLVFWTSVLAIVSAVAAFQHRYSSRHPAGRKLEPYTYLVLSSVIGFFVYLCLRKDAFEAMPLDMALSFADHYGVPVGPNGALLDGKGLNPQLNNYWFVIHPPCLYLGLIIFTVPFAFGIAALISGELGEYWVRIARRWAMVSWMFLTCGIILGGLWAYRQLGWGGYWAWDPVENASFLPWCTATAFLHSIMIQERRDMLRWWNVFLMIFTFFLTIEATYMTRSGEVASVHTFALDEEIGFVFRVFKAVVIGLGGFLLFFRFRELRGTHRLESILSREGAFFVNNLVLVAMALAVWFLSWLPTNSLAYVGKHFAVDVPYYNKVMTPLFLALLLLTAVGPALAWVRTTPRSLRKNLLVPTVVSLVGTGLVYAWLAATDRIGSAKTLFVPKFIADALAETKDSADVYWAEGLYPTGIGIFACLLILAVCADQLVRAVRGRMRARGDDFGSAVFKIVTRDNRRWGGYIVHVGIAVLAIGVLASSMFRIYEGIQIRIGETRQVGPYYITPVVQRHTADGVAAAEVDLRAGRRTLSDVEPGLGYLLDQIEVRVSKVESTVREAEAAGAATPATVAERAEAAPEVCRVHPERRFYPKQNQWIPEIGIDRGILRDVYLTFQDRVGDRLVMEVYVNPLIGLIWIGWFIMIFGGLFALLPLGPKRVGLSD